MNSKRIEFIIKSNKRLFHLPQHWKHFFTAAYQIKNQKENKGSQPGSHCRYRKNLYSTKYYYLI